MYKRRDSILKQLFDVIRIALMLNVTCQDVEKLAIRRYIDHFKVRTDPHVIIDVTTLHHLSVNLFSLQLSRFEMSLFA